MAFAVFTELFVLVVGKGRPRWRWLLLGTYFALVVLSHSKTALLLSLGYLVGTGIYLIWQRNRVTGFGISMVAAGLPLGRPGDLVERSAVCAWHVGARHDPNRTDLVVALGDSTHRAAAQCLAGDTGLCGNRTIPPES